VLLWLTISEKLINVSKKILKNIIYFFYGTWDEFINDTDNNLYKYGV